MVLSVFRQLLLVTSLVVGLPSMSVAQSGAAIQAMVERGQYADAVRQAEEQAELGDGEARAWLAHMFRHGLGVPQDIVRAAELDQVSAAAGIARSQNALGHSLIMGLGIEADERAGLDWLRRAAEAGEAQYVFDYAQALTSDLNRDPDPAEAVVWYQRAADLGFVEAQVNLGILYMTGQGVSQDFDRARELFTGAAEVGEAQAQNNLGLLHVRGEGVPRDYQAAFYWFQMAAEQDLPEALRNLSVLYESGQGAPLDEAQARRLLARARTLESGGLDQLLSSIGFPLDPRLLEPDWAEGPDVTANRLVEGGDAVALYLQAQRLVRGGGVRQDFQAARSMFQAAADRGSSAAEFSLCLLYARGLGVPQNYSTAYVWCSLAAYRGYPDAALIRDSLALEMTGAQVESAGQELARRLSPE